ncbi:hypothetical protein FS842_007465 [Serendipita sp. 407]|nr:hypothetical protein FRC15_009638 [Serendipita sp. 397]KAG8796824.1 hypothetical protein FRC16_009492 [Serendipita sp. 398]KAG8838224.1 hypothetical protein FRC18_005722 [Serendipita sp. 400]KAG9057326.1 hypothetical protein FS842_007465 [Serendipita sp. 407]
MSQPVSGSLLFQDGTSERDFIAVSAQNSSVPDLHYEFRTSSSQYGNGTQVNTTVTGRASTSMHHSSSSGSSITTAMVLFAEIGWVSNKMGTVKVYITRPPLELATASLCLPGGKIGSRCFLMNWNGVEAKSQFTWTRDNSAYTVSPKSRFPIRACPSSLSRSLDLLIFLPLLKTPNCVLIGGTTFHLADWP